MAHAREDACAYTGVVKRVFPECFRQRVAGCGPNARNAKVGGKTLAITLCPLFPFRRRIVELVDTGRGRSLRDWNGAEGDKRITAHPLLRRWANRSEEHTSE